MHPSESRSLQCEKWVKKAKKGLSGAKSVYKTDIPVYRFLYLVCGACRKFS